MVGIVKFILTKDIHRIITNVNIKHSQLRLSYRFKVNSSSLHLQKKIGKWGFGGVFCASRKESGGSDHFLGGFTQGY